MNHATPADAYLGRDKHILEKRNLMKQKTIKKIINAKQDKLEKIEKIGPKKAKEIKRILEEELKIGVENCGAETGVGILMNPQTGEIVALANFPTFDPAKYLDSNSSKS